jgi:predicted outer membrane protein
MLRWIIVLASVAACGESDNENERVKVVADGGEISIGDAGTVTGDEQIAAVVQAEDTTELDEDQLAATNATDPNVAAFGRRMRDERTLDQGDLQAVLDDIGGTAQAAQLSDDETAAGTTDVSALQSTPSGAQFDATYVGLQEARDQRILDLIDDRLIPAVQTDSMRTFLTNLRAQVAADLTAASQL